MYPLLPYPGYNWSMNHHMGVATEENLFALIWAANMFGQNSDPNYDINNYLIANDLLTKNIRSDSGQPDAWRDYQQIASELGLLFSTKRQKEITPTPLGLAFIEKKVRFNELLTLQALRYQYPNGHKSNISNSLRQQIADTKFKNVGTLTELQAITGVQIRPAVLIWKVLRELQNREQKSSLSVIETQMFLLPCKRHSDTLKAVQEIINFRQVSANESSIRLNREIQEWFRFLFGTLLFVRGRDKKQTIALSDFGLRYAKEIDSICTNLERPETFWIPDLTNVSNNISWYSEFGAIDVDISTISFENDDLESDESEFEDEERDPKNNSLQNINLRKFNSENLTSEIDFADSEDENNQLIAYEKQKSKTQHTLHDRMTIMIANTCLYNGGQVFDDPKSVDLLVGFKDYEFLVEVKSVTSRNFIKRLRLALGQLLHYDYLRSMQSQSQRRRVLAFAARISKDSWSIPFINDHLDFDLLTLGNQGLELNSNFELSKDLFANSNKQIGLFDDLQ